jgi:3-oxoacyl-[acyl-carrier protein] reductase
MANDNQKLALLTGAAGVVGQATARALVHNNYRVIMVDLDEEKLDQLEYELGELARPMVLDISRSEQVVQACEMIRRDIGTVSVLINNAGVLSNNKLTETDNDEWHRILAVNLDGVFYLCRAWLPAMKAQKWGRIVNICSLAMKTGGLTAGTAYTASKGALGALTFSIAREAAPFGVTVNGIAPAYIKTPMVTDFLSTEKQRQLTEQIPVGRFCEPEEVAHAVLFLISPLSGFITGEILDVNGGLQMD